MTKPTDPAGLAGPAPEFDIITTALALIREVLFERYGGDLVDVVALAATCRDGDSAGEIRLIRASGTSPKMAERIVTAAAETLKARDGVR